MRIGSHDLTERVLIVAEIGNNHEGDLSRAEEMIHRAAEAGVDAVKFQTIVPERLVSAGQTARIAQLGRFRFDLDQFRHLAGVARGAGVEFFSTPFDLDSVAALDPFVPAFKIASGDNDFWPLIESAARTGKPLILSTGLLDLEGVARAKARIDAVWRERGVDPGLALLHCVVAYPAPAEQANLGAIRALAGLGAVPGYSDHTLGIDAAVLAVALGARVIEKHFTLDKAQSDFRDHQLSADPRDMAELVRRIRAAEFMIGDGVKRPMPAEQPNAQPVRRSIVAARDLPAGHRIAAADLTWVRPMAGLRPGEEALVLGRVLRAPVAHGDPVTPDLTDGN